MQYNLDPKIIREKMRMEQSNIWKLESNIYSMCWPSINYLSLDNILQQKI